MKKKYLLVAISVLMLILFTACGSDSGSDEDNSAATEQETTTEQNEFGATVSNDGGDFDVSIKKITDKGIVLICENKDDVDSLTATVNYVEVKGNMYDPAEADDGAALKMIDLDYPDMNVAWIDLEPGRTAEIKIVCDDCESAEDYKNLSVNYNENIWDSTEEAPQTYTYEALSIDVEAQ